MRANIATPSLSYPPPTDLDIQLGISPINKAANKPAPYL